MSTPEQKVLEEFRQQFPDIHDAVQVMVRTETEGKIKPIENRLEQDAQSRFTESLTKAVPDWEAICQADPRWPAWLNEPYRYSSRSRLELLREAIAHRDAESVSHMLEDFKANPTAGVPGIGTPPGQQQQTNLILRKTVKEFFSAKAQGLYRGREKEAEAIEKQITEAMLTGRII